MQPTELQNKLTVAEILTKARCLLGLTKIEAAKKSGVLQKYVDFFEGTINDVIATDVYTRHKLRIYCKFLNLDTKKIAALFLREHPVQTIIELKNDSYWRRHPLKNIPSSQLLVAPRIIKTAGILMAVLGIGLFFLIQARHMLAPPEIILTSPPDGLVTTEKTLPINGQTEREVTLLINSKPVYIDNNGKFSDQIDLREGLNTIRVIAIRKHGQESEITRRIIVKSTERPTAAIFSATKIIK